MQHQAIRFFSLVNSLPPFSLLLRTATLFHSFTIWVYSSLSSFSHLARTSATFRRCSIMSLKAPIHNNQKTNAPINERIAITSICVCSTFFPGVRILIKARLRLNPNKVTSNSILSFLFLLIFFCISLHHFFNDG